ncbi:putative DNA binding domain-containing protein [Fusobacterium animalis]
MEFKRADNNLPNSLWGTYSAFCNTSGGIIILGIEEEKNGDNIIIGINDIDKMEKDIWNTANNLAKVSYNVIGNGDIYKVKIDDKNIMILDIKEAPHNKKPVYLNRKIENTYIRRGEADKKADNDEIGTLMAMATPKPLLLDNFSMKDLDSETVSKFRKIIEERYPEKNYKNLNDEDFLKEPFALNEEKVRVSNTSLLIEAIREALVNTLIHADYLQNFPKVKIEMFEGWINFENSGKMLITKDEYVQGGNSVIRNEILVQLVRLIGIAERQGFGGVKICKTSESLFKQQPEIITDLRETKLKLWTVDALHFREDLSVLDKKIYHILLKNNQPLTRKEIISISENTEHFVKKSLINLLEKGLITTIGNGRSTKYEISFGTQGYLTKIQMKLQTLAKLNNLLSED